MQSRTISMQCPACRSHDCLIPRMLGKPYESIVDLAAIGLVFLDSDVPLANDTDNHWHCKRCFASVALFDDPDTDIAERNKRIDKLLDETSRWNSQQWIEARQRYGFELFALHLHRDFESIEVYGDDVAHLRACGRMKDGEEIPFPVFPESCQLACEHLRKRLSAIGNCNRVRADQLFDDSPQLLWYTVQPSFDESNYRMTFRLATSE